MSCLPAELIRSVQAPNISVVASADETCLNYAVLFDRGYNVLLMIWPRAAV